MVCHHETNYHESEQEQSDGNNLAESRERDTIEKIKKVYPNIIIYYSQSPINILYNKVTRRIQKVFTLIKILLSRALVLGSGQDR